MSNDEIIEIAREAGLLAGADMASDRNRLFVAGLVNFADLVAAKEREACAEVCCQLAGMAATPDSAAYWMRMDCAAAIRASGKKQAMTEAIYIPKGSMCMACANASVECVNLQFHAMPVIKVYDDGVKAVKCAAFSQKSKEAK